MDSRPIPLPLLLLLLLLTTSALALFADTLTLRDGRTVRGTFVGGDSRQIRFAAGDRVETYRLLDIDTAAVTESSASRTGKSEKVIGGGTVLGAIIGAIAGGGKGAVGGAGAGTAVQVVTKGQRVKIPAETRLTFSLQQAVRL